MIPVDAILIANGFAVGDATKVSVNLTNTLVAVWQSGTSALINKNDVGAVVIPTDGSVGPAQVPLPEPGTLALIGAGLISLTLRGRRF
jgi:hypothetical protein